MRVLFENKKLKYNVSFLKDFQYYEYNVNYSLNDIEIYVLSLEVNNFTLNKKNFYRKFMDLV